MHMICRARPTSTATQLLLYVSLASCADDCELLCSRYGWGDPRSVVVSVVDARGNPVPIDSAVVEQGSQSHPCAADPSSSSVACQSNEAGPGTLRVDVQGQTLSRDIDVGLTDSHNCGRAQEVELRLSGPACPAPSGVAIEGRLLDASGQEVTGGSVEVDLHGRQQVCTVYGARFHCESMASYTATYTLSARFGSSRVEQSVRVPAQSCNAMLTDATIDLSVRECDPSERRTTAVVMPVTVPAGASARARIYLDASHSADCTSVTTLTPTDLQFECPGLTPTGGGSYRVEVSVGSATKSAQTDVVDDGCWPIVSWLNFSF